jgi:serine/threonine protein kinase
LKPVSPSLFELSEELRHEFGNNCRIRTHIDHNEEERVLVYEYFMSDLLDLVKHNANLSIDARKFILREIGLGLKAMHDKHWIHLGKMR